MLRTKARTGGFVSPRGRSVLVTGASSGLGRDCALHLVRAGFRVFAGVRRAEDGERLVAGTAAGRIHPVRLDVTDEESVRTAVGEIAEATELAESADGAAGPPGLWGLVNNAGICVSGPLECVRPAQLRRQLETNVVGQLSVVQAALPLLREARGRIVNITSGLGNVAVPYLGAYASAQFAKEALSDALRRELRPHGVGVSVVQPGAISTPIWDKASTAGNDMLAGSPEAVADLYRATFGRFLRAHVDQARASRTRPEEFTRAVAHALGAARPRTRYRVGADAWLSAVLSRALPDIALDHRLRPVTAAAPQV
ncbi:SDR family oxidoreductase [Streptomyces sp. NPDC021093]|uniref:SDR family oxidoreductase n=1 Tax=Streptomyces sp. NPDC021093 TaxID=3365112 RepID=UPI0037924185